MKTLVYVFALTIALSVLALAGCGNEVRGPGGKTMTVDAPTLPVSIDRGESETISIGIERRGFTDEVTVEISDLPDGVTVDDSRKDTATNQAVFVLKTTRDTPLVDDHRVKVTTWGPDDMRSIQYFDLSVTD